MEKLNLKVDSNHSHDLDREEDPKIKYISFTDLFAIKQDGLEKLLSEGYVVYILSKKIPPIKLTMAQLS